MNYRMILYIIGWVMNILALCFTLPIAVGLFYGESQWAMYALTMIVTLVFGVILTCKKPKRTSYYTKDGFVTVALCWIILSLIGAVPFTLTGEIPSYLDAVFESASGFTTTGASILTNIEAVSHCSLFWRSFTHWVGGMGVLVFILAIVPLAGGGSTMQLMRAESPGPSVGKLVPRVRHTAFILYAIYFAMTVLETVLLLLGGMPWFDAITTAFGTAGTGGFSVRNASIAFYDGSYLQNVITVFMLLFAVNFSVYYLLLLKKFSAAAKNEELRWYIAIVVFAILCITLNNYKTNFGGDFALALHHSAFSVASIISTTGFATVDFNTWPQLSKFILFLLMFIGASAGSTGGGIKVSRIILLVKSSLREISAIIHPKGVRVVKLDGKRIDHETLKSTTAFFVVCILTYVISVFIVCFDGYDMTTSLSAVAATMNNIGPGFEIVGPSGNYSMFSPSAKIVLIFDMLAGRLEYFPMLVLFAPTTWKEAAGAVKRRVLRKRRRKAAV